jgi:voltage-gated potassium channel
MDAQQRARAFEAVERAVELPMLVLSLALLPIVVVPLLITLPTEWELAWQTVGWMIWAAFAAELTVKTYLAPRRLRYLRDHWFDVLIVAIPFLRPLRMFHALRALRLLQLLRLISVGAKVTVAAREVLGRRGLPYAILVGGLLILASTVAVTYAERGHGGSIDDFGTALWWAMATVTTVGYGDVAPTTPAGRGVAVFVMLIGITLFGLFTANAATFLLQSRGRGDPHKDVTLSDIAAQLQRLEAQVAELRTHLGRADHPSIERGENGAIGAGALSPSSAESSVEARG